MTAAIDAVYEFGAIDLSAGIGTIDGSLSQDRNVNDVTDADELVITAADPGPNFNHVNVDLRAGPSPVEPQAQFEPQLRRLLLTIHDSLPTPLGALADAINRQVPDFQATASRGRGDNYVLGNTADVDATSSTGVTGGAWAWHDLVLDITGSAGREVFTYGMGASVNQIVDATTLVAEHAGVAAKQDNGLFTLESTDFGKNALIDVAVILDGRDRRFEKSLSAVHSTGSDIVATVNGELALGNGNELSLVSPELDFSAIVAPGSNDDLHFEIAGGVDPRPRFWQRRAGPIPRLGIASARIHDLGGIHGHLSDLLSGGPADLHTDTSRAMTIVNEAIDRVLLERAKLGVYEKDILEAPDVSRGRLTQPT